MRKKHSRYYLAKLIDFDDKLAELRGYISITYDKIKENQIDNETLLKFNYSNYVALKESSHIIEELCDRYWIDSIPNNTFTH